MAALLTAGLATTGLVSAVATVAVVLPGPEATARTDRPPVTCRLPGSAATEAPEGSGGGAGGALSSAELAVVDAIVAAGRQRSITRRGVVIAVQTAMQESGLRADARSGRAIGAFQQIAPGPDNAYTGYDRTDPSAAAAGFYRVLLARAPRYDIDTRPNHELAQLVQASGAGAATYAPHQPLAEAVVAARTGEAGTSDALECTDLSVSGPVRVEVAGTAVTLPAEAGVAGVVHAPNEQAATAIAAALSYLGTPYAWGGGNDNGPTKGVRDGGGAADQHQDYLTVGFDCSGLTQYAWSQAGVHIGGDSRAQRATGGGVLPLSAVEPGDLLFWGDGSISAIHHVAIYLGPIDDTGVEFVVQAPQSGDVVRVSRLSVGGDLRDEVVRPSVRRASDAEGRRRG